MCNAFKGCTLLWRRLCLWCGLVKSDERQGEKRPLTKAVPKERSRATKTTSQAQRTKLMPQDEKRIVADETIVPGTDSAKEKEENLSFPHKCEPYTPYTPSLQSLPTSTSSTTMLPKKDTGKRRHTAPTLVQSPYQVRHFTTTCGDAIFSAASATDGCSSHYTSTSSTSEEGDKKLERRRETNMKRALQRDTLPS